MSGIWRTEASVRNRVMVLAYSGNNVLVSVVQWNIDAKYRGGIGGTPGELRSVPASSVTVDVHPDGTPIMSAAQVEVLS